MCRFHKLIVVLFIVFFSSVFSQNKMDVGNLIQLDYSALKDSIFKSQGDSLKFHEYSNAYFLKAKKNNDTSEIASGYYFRIIKPGIYKRHDLYDSIIKLTSTSKEKLNYPTIAFYDKAVIYLKSSKYSDALSNLIKATNYNNGSNKEYLQFLIDVNIADIKLRIGNNEEGLNLLKKSFKYAIENDFEEKNFHRYSYNLFNLANAYRKLNYIDSATTYTRMGLQKSKNKNDIYHYFALLQSIIDLEYKYEGETVDNLKKNVHYFDSLQLNTNSSLGYYYLGRAHLKNDEYNKAIKTFKKVDSLYDKKPSIILPETIDTYKYLIFHFKNEKDYKNELHYLNKYVKYDSILDVNYSYINNNLKKEYDLPLITKDRETIIKKLNKKNKIFNRIIIFTSCLIFVSVFFVIWQIEQRKKQNLRIEELLKVKQIKISDSRRKLKNLSNDHLNFSKELIQRIQDGIQKFEKDKSYLNRDINAKALANSIGTNTSYFTRIFYSLYQVKFNTYLNDERLNYAFERLKAESIFRKYTIKSIAKESGFGSAESFSKHFFRKYGVYPSVFIKALNSN